MAQPCSGCSLVKECDASSTQLSVILGILEGGIQQWLTVTQDCSYRSAASPQQAGWLQQQWQWINFLFSLSGARQQ